jgi:hypothetical protein
VVLPASIIKNSIGFNFRDSLAIARTESNGILSTGASRAEVVILD